MRTFTPLYLCWLIAFGLLLAILPFPFFTVWIQQYVNFNSPGFSFLSWLPFLLFASGTIFGWMLNKTHIMVFCLIFILLLLYISFIQELPPIFQPQTSLLITMGIGLPLFLGRTVD